MALRSNVFKIALATAVGLVIGVGTQTETEASGYRYLCTTKPNACEYAPSTAPTLNADVCWSSSNGVKLKGTGNCPSGSYPFFVDSGEVTDPVTGAVQAYITIPNACDMGYCINDPNLPPGTDGPMCCTSGGCVETDGICPATEVAVWCDDGQEPVNQNGNWVCKETA